MGLVPIRLGYLVGELRQAKVTITSLISQLFENHRFQTEIETGADMSRIYSLPHYLNKNYIMLFVRIGAVEKHRLQNVIIF
jgi:hypothetical protein